MIIRMICIISALSFMTSTNVALAANLLNPSPPTGLKIGADPVSPPSTPPPSPPPGNASLMVGMTPDNYKIPTGWSIIRAQNFEGTKPDGEWWGRWHGKVTATKPHSGTKGIEGTYSSDQSDVGWTLDGSAVGSFTEIYLSFFEFIDQAALFNDEYFQYRFQIDDGNGFQELVGDWVWAYDSKGEMAFNQPRATLYVWLQGLYEKRQAPKGATVPKGAWHQWEIHFRPNTVGNNNGFVRVYLDGNMFQNLENAQIVGRSMNSCDVQAGGVYTKNVWMRDYPTCSVPAGCTSAPGIGSDACTYYKGWPYQTFSNPVCNPIDPPLPNWKRYIDDVVVMKR